jgi:hypothetical protein
VKVIIKDRLPRQYDLGRMGDALKPAEDLLNLLGEHYKGKASAAPTIGSYVRCDFFQNSLPSPSGHWGFICVESGSPGTWKDFGLIAV